MSPGEILVFPLPASHTDDLEVVRPDGTQVRLEIFGNPVRDFEGRIIASLVSFLEITGH